MNAFDEVRDFAQRLVLIHSLMADERNFHHYSSLAQLRMTEISAVVNRLMSALNRSLYDHGLIELVW